MKTIIVIYTAGFTAKTGYQTRYAFNTDDDIKVDDMLESSSYSTNMQVVKVLPLAYLFFNKETGEMSNEYTSSKQFEIKTLRLAEPEDIIFAKKLNTGI